MAHMIETIAYAGETPWHKLGIEVSDDLTPKQMAQAAGLAWTMEKLPVLVNFHGSINTVPNKFNLTRMTDGFVMDVVSDLYKPVQPEQALDFFKRFVTAGHMKMQTAGSLDHGRRIWALASIEASFTLKGGDTVKGFLLLCSPNKAGESLTIKFCATRVVCNNTITMALREEALTTEKGNKTVTVRMNHLQDFTEARQEEAIAAMGIATDQLETLQQQAELLASATAERQRVIEYVAKVSGSKILESAVSSTAQVGANGTDVLASIVAANESVAAVREIQESDLNRAGKMILEAITSSPGADMESAKGTWWGALNGVTYAVDHVLGREDTRLNSAWYGDRAKTKQTALDLAVEYAMAQTAN